MRNIEENIEKTLNALDGLAPAQAPEGFEASILERLQFMNKSSQWLKYCAAALVVLGLLNIFAIFSDTTDPVESDELSEYISLTTAPILTFSEDE